jgi:hypothetical protein
MRSPDFELIPMRAPCVQVLPPLCMQFWVGGSDLTPGGGGGGGGH